jgi:hypothetical protein
VLNRLQIIVLDPVENKSIGCQKFDVLVLFDHLQRSDPGVVLLG